MYRVQVVNRRWIDVGEGDLGWTIDEGRQRAGDSAFG